MALLIRFDPSILIMSYPRHLLAYRLVRIPICMEEQEQSWKTHHDHDTRH